MTTAVATLPEPSTLIAAVELPSPDSNSALVYLARLGKRSQRVMHQALDVIAGIASGGQFNAEMLPWGALRFQHTAAIRAALIERYDSIATVNRTLSALRGVLKAAWLLGHMTAEDYHRASQFEPAKGKTLPAGRAVTDGELRALFSVCAADATPAGSRDAALLAVLYGAGLRRSEAVALDVADYSAETGELHVRHGKGNKARLVYATNGGKVAIETWLQARGDKPGALLCPVRKGGKVQLRRMTGYAVTRIMKKRATQANVQDFTPHDLRRGYISHLLDAGADISTVQQLAGHSSVTTTTLYDRRGEATKRKAAELVHVPYSGPHQRTGCLDGEIKTVTVS